MSRQRVKVLVTGAAGQIGYALLFRLASGQMFGPETEIELSLLEVESSLPSLEGVVMELEDCAFPLLKAIHYTSDVTTATRDVNWALLIGAAPRKAGMERSDLLAVNGKIFMTQGRALNEYAAEDVQVFVVGNPCNTNCLIAQQNAPDIPPERFFAMTSLDELRAKAQLAKKAGVGVEHVTCMTIWGNHSTTQYPDFYHAKIMGQPAVDICQDEAWLQQEFIPLIQKRGAAVIAARGASSAASAANAIIYGVQQLIQETPEQQVYSMATYSHGEYGVDEGLIFSYPCQTIKGHCQIVTGWEHNEFGQEKLRITLDELRKEKATIQELGLIGFAQ